MGMGGGRSAAPPGPRWPAAGPTGPCAGARASAGRRMGPAGALVEHVGGRLPPPPCPAGRPVPSAGRLSGAGRAGAEADGGAMSSGPCSAGGGTDGTARRAVGSLRAGRAWAAPSRPRAVGCARLRPAAGQIFLSPRPACPGAMNIFNRGAWELSAALVWGCFLPDAYDDPRARLITGVFRRALWFSLIRSGGLVITLIWPPPRGTAPVILRLIAG